MSAVTGPHLVQQLDARIFDALGIKNRGAGYTAFLSTQVVPVVQIPLSLQAANQLGFNDPETINDAAYLAFISRAAVAASTSNTQLLNPTGSGRLVMIDEIRVWSGTGNDSFYVGYGNTALANLDGRVVNCRAAGINGQTQRRHAAGAAVITSATAFAAFTTASATELGQRRFDPPIVLAEGEGIVISNTQVNQAQNANWSLREYPAST